MTLKDIAVFKHFISGKDVRRPFISVYNASKQWAKLPDSIEEYLSNADPMSVITKAARVCRPNSAYGYDFWQELNEEWKQFLAKASQGDYYQGRDLPKLSGYYSILRENWNDKDKPWRFEELADAQARLGLKPVEKVEHSPLVDSSVVPEADAEDNTLSDFEFLDEVKFSRNRLKCNEASINFNNSYKITFNIMASEVIRESKLPFVRLAKSKAGDICLVFNLVGGANITNKTGVNTTQNVTINSKDICEKLRTLFSIRPDYSILRIDRLQSTNDYIIYKITKQQ
jgi:hypothetical protein